MAQVRNTDESYGILAQALHWLLAVLVFAQLALGLYAAGLPLGIERLRWLSRHKSLGLAVLALVLLRLAWRAASAPPALPASMPQRERGLALATHRLIYLLLVLAPLAGWMQASASGLSVNWFGLFLVPDLVPKGRALAELFRLAHLGCVALLAALVAGHVGAALRHALILRDGVMRRMLPWAPRARR
jgi:cytochrome b561